MVIWAWAENMSKRMPSQTPNHSFMGHLHPTHFFLYPVTAPQKVVFFTKVTQPLPHQKRHLLLVQHKATKVCYFESGQFHMFQRYWFVISNIVFYPESASEGKCFRNDRTTRNKEVGSHSPFMTSIAKKRDAKFSIPNWVYRYRTYEHSEKIQNTIIFFMFRCSLHKIYNFFT